MSGLSAFALSANKEARVFPTSERTAVRQSPGARRSGPVAAFAILATGVVLTITGTGRADSMPIGPLPAGAVSTIKTGPNQLVAVALPRNAKSSGLIWRIARPYKSTILRQISEADVGGNVVLVFKVTGRGTTVLVFALTRGDTSPKAIKSATQTVVSR
jgi:hypothetical protein